ncbi:hypothetical protein Ddye_028991 [Dipteronia dyeriana]|uniref:Protein FAR1-RELATED SEQUENCE n=1 Tax=Dipteronia dyeriana TaxID=168575 RepID=A0AAD9WK69_9ROSI|nr:hypothetical protein Ddye_028991 [Dipteronia dyeriana]
MEKNLGASEPWNLMVRPLRCRTIVVIAVFSPYRRSGVWTISHINLNHNHELAKAEERQFLKSDRKIPKTHGNIISSMVDAGVRPTQEYFYLASEVGGVENSGFTKKDLGKVTREPETEELAYLFQIGSLFKVPRGQFYAKAKNKLNFIIPSASRKDPVWKEEWILVGDDWGSSTFIEGNEFTVPTDFDDKPS